MTTHQPLAGSTARLPKLAQTTYLLIAVACAIALVATACGGSTAADNASGPGSGSGDGSEESSPAASETGPRTTESPLGDLIGIPFGDDDASDQYFADLSRQAEVKIAECMLAQGFEYQVVDYSQIDSFGAEIDFESREFATEFGFGISSDPFEESYEAFESFEDPNQNYLEGLTEGERDAYQTALTGEPQIFGSTTEFDNFELTGCQGDAFDEVYAFGDVLDQFGDAFDELEAAYEADPRIVEASSGWSDCMSEAGFRFADDQDAREDFQRRYDALVRDPGAFVDEFSAVDEALDDEAVFVYGPQSLAPEVQAKVDVLAAEEREVATAAWDCNDPIRAIEDDIRLEYEQRFVDENGAAIRAALDE